MICRITLDESGNQIDALAERNEEIKANLQEKMEVLLSEKESDTKGKKRLGFRMGMQISNELNKYGRMTAEDFVELTADTIEYYWNSFYDLMCYYNLYFEIVPNRQMFLRYAGMNARMYQQLQESPDEDVRTLMIFIEDSLKEDGFSAGENGNADAKAIYSRLSAKSDGHNMVSAGDEMLAQAAVTASPDELSRRMNAILKQHSDKLLK